MQPGMIARGSHIGVSVRRAPPFLLALGLAMVLADSAFAGAAPLDTLREAGIDSSEIDLRYAPAAIDISRKLLPDVGATVVPQDQTPNRPPRLDDPLAGAWRFHRARRAAAAGDPIAATENLKAALNAAPGRVDYRWWQTLQAARSLDTATLMRAVPRSLRAVLNAPLSRYRFLATAHQAALLLVGIFWTVFTLAMLAANWRFLAHDLSARLFRDRRHLARGGLPFLLPLVLVGINPGWFGFLAALSLPLLVVARGRARGLLAVTWTVAALLVFPGWPFLRQTVPALDPQSETVLLDHAAVMPASSEYIAPLTRRLEDAQDPERRARLQTALAIQEARRGHYTRSNKLFAEVLAHDQDNFPALVGTANNTYFLGRLDNAVARYDAAALRHPGRGEIPYNLAQVYFKKLFIPEATTALETARALGFEAPTIGDSGPAAGYAPVVYPGMSSPQLVAACAYEAGNYPPLVTISSWRYLLGVPPVPTLALVGLPLLLALMLISMSKHQRDPRECENCGVPLCRSCCKVRDTAWLCSACGETADRARSDMILATLLKNRSRDEGLARSARVVRLGRLLPGAGHLLNNCMWAAWFRLSMMAAGLFLLTGAWAFDPGAGWTTPGLLLDTETLDPAWLPLPAALWPGWTAPMILAGAALIVVTWLIALLDGPGLKRGLQDRHSLAPSAVARSGPRVKAH